MDLSREALDLQYWENEYERFHQGEPLAEAPLPRAVDRKRFLVNRIHWRDFIPKRTFKVIRSIMHMAGYDLIVEFNNANEATDVYVTSRG
jgi:hypothetical protein